MKNKKRLDLILSELCPQYSRTQIQSFIMQGHVYIDGTKSNKPGVLVDETSDIILSVEPPRYVCRAGLKLEKALQHFALDVTGMIVLDAGLSTGGFTDCLLQHGARQVYGVDVGYGQVHEKIRVDPRVVVLERMNIKEYVHAGDPLSLITLDLSFISLLKVISKIDELLPSGGRLITLIKPQFEAGRDQVPAGGVIRDEALQQQLVEQVKAGIEAAGFACYGTVESPIRGAAGNREFLAYFIKQ